MAPSPNMAGLRFGRLLVLRRAANGPSRNSRWECRCDCGGASVVARPNLQSGAVASCGCLHGDALRGRAAHGLLRRGTLHPLYWTWSNMIQRCTNPARLDFPRYGGRGISVCARWLNDFAAFVADVGPKPTARHSIDRIDNDGNYEPGNVRWATPHQQAANRRPRRKSR